MIFGVTAQCGLVAGTASLQMHQVDSGKPASTVLDQKYAQENAHD
jgi:hypothetical protein